MTLHLTFNENCLVWNTQLKLSFQAKEIYVDTCSPLLKDVDALFDAAAVDYCWILLKTRSFLDYFTLSQFPISKKRLELIQLQFQSVCVLPSWAACLPLLVLSRIHFAFSAKVPSRSIEGSTYCSSHFFKNPSVVGSGKSHFGVALEANLCSREPFYV